MPHQRARLNRRRNLLQKRSRQEERHLSLSLQKRLAADLMNCGESRVRFDSERLEDIESAITREEVWRLIEDGAIYKIQSLGVSRGRFRGSKKRKGTGSREGKIYSSLPRKRRWIRRVRSQRKLLSELRDKRMMDRTTYRRVYLLIKAGSFKDTSTLMSHLREAKLIRRGRR